MKKAKTPKNQYVLFGCPIDLSVRYDVKGYIVTDNDHGITLLDDINLAHIYDGDIPDGHGSPKDWCQLFKEDYGFNVHPVRYCPKT